MKITTYQFGEVEFEENSVINFPSGIFGFENLKNHLLISKPKTGVSLVKLN
jgi:flagellar assembly factor FliW